MNPTQLLNKCSSPLLYYSGAYLRAWQKQARHKPFTVILMYHRIVSNDDFSEKHFGVERGISARIFEAQIRFMLKHFTPTQSSQVLDDSPYPLRFAVTLDDGYEDNFLVAAPILRRLGVSATFYVVSDYVGTERLFWWEQLADMIHQTHIPEIDINFIKPGIQTLQNSTTTRLPLGTQPEREKSYEKISAILRDEPHANLAQIILKLSEILSVPIREEGRQYGLMNWDQLKKLSHQGFEIGGHTATHCNLKGASENMITHEVVSSTSAINNQLGVPALTFAYPYGKFQKNNTFFENLLKDNGYKTAVTCEKGVVNNGSRAFELSRTKLNRQYHFACGYNIQDTLK